MKDREPNPLPGIRREIEEFSGFSLNLRVGEMHQQEIKLIRDDVRPGASVPTSPLQPRVEPSVKEGVCLRRSPCASEDAGTDFPRSSHSDSFKTNSHDMDM